MQIPPTAALRAFETAARLLSFTEAAHQLNLTQGAISHQIRDLEARLGTRLFDRVGRGIALSEAGKRYLPFVRDALDRLRMGADALHPGHSGNVLTVSVSPNFATKWLVPRLGAFMEAHPDLDLRISASLHHVDFQAEGIDMAIRHGDGYWPDFFVARLCLERIFPVLQPRPARRRFAPWDTLDGLRRQTLIHDRDRDGWANWLHEVGFDPEEIDLMRGPVLNQTSLAIDAAVAGQGVALARSALAALDLASGRLVRPLAQSIPARYAYWVVCPKRLATAPKIVRFRDWLMKETDADALTTADRGGASPHAGHALES